MMFDTNNTTQNQTVVTQAQVHIPSSLNTSLELEICTPSDFDPASVSSSSSCTTARQAQALTDEERLMDTTLDADFDLDSETDSDGDLDLDVDMDLDADAEGESDDDELISPHESLLSFPSPPTHIPIVPSMSTPSSTYNTTQHNNPSPFTYDPLTPIDPALAHLPLPSISSIPAYCLRGFGGVDGEAHGTPNTVTEEAKGCLESLRRGRGRWGGQDGLVQL